MKAKPNNQDNPLDSYLNSLLSHQREQSQAAVDTFSDMVSAHYLRLRANGVPPAATLELTKTFMAALFINNTKES